MSFRNITSGPGREIETPVFGKPGTVLLESIRRDSENSFSFLYEDPAAVIQCTSPAMVQPCIEQIEGATRKGMHAAGYISYEAGQAWNPGSFLSDDSRFPLLWFGLYEKVQRFESPLLLPVSDHLNEPVHHTLDIQPREYEQQIRKILQFIRDGETYQVNFTTRARFHWKHGARQLYLRLRRFQPVPYGAFLNCGKYSVISLSPELFLRKSGNNLQTRPMKGTAARGADTHADEQAKRWLQNDPKNLAENLMIVDLMRNDLGQVAKTGSINVHDPFKIETYSSLLQMTSEIRCNVREGVSLLEMLKATFPPGSITGAPKINTMQIISQLEKTPRKVYTGAVGTIDPKGDLTMSVAIRTIICHSSGKCEMGVGSGIVSDSIPQTEFEETRLKADFLNNPGGDRVDLFETMLFQEDGSVLWLDEHLERLEGSAKELAYPFDRKKAVLAVESHLQGQSGGAATVRMILTVRGEFHVETLPPPVKRKRIVLIISRCRTDPSDHLLRHKTTRRELYDRELAMAREQGYFEALFTNTHGHLTEGAFTNLFILKGAAGGSSSWYTPDLQCGLLPGIWRRKFIISTGSAEACLGLDELSTAQEVTVGNSVRGAMEVDEIVDAAGRVIYSKPVNPGS